MEYTRRVCNRTRSSQAASWPPRQRSTSWTSASKLSVFRTAGHGDSQDHFAEGIATVAMMLPIACFQLRKRGTMIRSSLESKVYILASESVIYQGCSAV